MKSFVPEENDYDVFYHLAWAGTTGTARDDADLQLKNIEYTLDAVELAKKWAAENLSAQVRRRNMVFAISR